LHEARLIRDPRANAKREWIKVFGLHGVVVGGMVLVIIGVINAINAVKPGPTSYTPNGLMKAGALILLASWAFLALWVLSSFRQPKSSTGAWRDGTIVSSTIPHLNQRFWLMCDSATTCSGPCPPIHRYA
jgi:hypothetical protein